MRRSIGLWVATALVVLAALGVFGAGGASAATLTVVGGELLGATDVIVGGNLYDVEFLDGTCIAVFGGCDDASDFAFAGPADATAAAQALLDQVFINSIAGPFDSVPGATAGCIGTLCNAFTPYGVPPAGDFLFVAARNYDAGLVDTVFPPQQLSASIDWASNETVTFAVWTPVPEPGTALLMGLGLVGLGARIRR